MGGSRNQDVFDKAFNMFDKAGGGSMSTSDVQYILKSLKTPNTSHIIDSKLQLIQTQPASDVSLNDFKEITKDIAISEDDPVNRFQYFVGDKQGTDKEMLKELFGKFDEDISGNDLQDMIDFVDKNKDSVVDVTEFKSVIKP